MIRIALPRRHVRETAFVVVAVLAILPFLVASVPGMADLPNHMARHHVFAVAGMGPLDQWLMVRWRWIGNLGVDLPVLLLAPWLGAEVATRAVVALIAPLTVLGILALARASHGRVTAGATLALPFVLSQPWFYGFVNYDLSVALALLAAAWWIRRPPTTAARLAIAAVAALVVWTAHIQGWAILLILIGGAELARVRSLGDLGHSAARGLLLLVPILPLLLWRGGSSAPAFTFAPDLLTSKVMIFATVLKGLSRPFDLGCIALLLLLAVTALISGRRIEPRLGTAATLLILAALILPTTVLGSWGADLRLAPVAVMVGLIAIGPARSPRIERAIFAAGIAIFLVRLSWTSVQWSRASDVLERRLAILDAVPRGSRMGFIVAEDQCGTPWTLSPDRKLGAYAVTRRDAFTNILFQIPGADLMMIRRPADRARWYDGSQDVPALCPGGEVDTPAIRARVDAMRRAGFDTIWIVGARSPSGYRVIASQGSDTLIEKAPTP